MRTRGVRVLLLGNAAVIDRECTHAIGSPRQATVLAALATRAGTTVSAEALIEDVWGAEAPSTARNTLQVHVSGLRRLLGASCIEGSRDGYRYAGEPRDVDLLRFCELVRRGVTAVVDRPGEAARLLRSALGLYRGDLLSGLPVSPGMDAERERLRRLWATASLARFDADLALGRHLLLVDELMVFARERPYDEEVAVRLMVALYRSGSQSEALIAYRGTVERLRADLGVDPGPRLRDLHQRILRHDPELGPAPSPGVSWRVPLAVPDGGLVGRDALLARLEGGLPTGRLHTLVGPSGIGKSRLALELAARCQGWYRDGAVRVDVSTARSAEDVLDLLLEALTTGLTAVPADSAERRRVLVGSRALMVLDGLAPDAAARPVLEELLDASQQATFVATSTRPTGLRGERIWPVPPLATEDTVDLLLARARQAGADLAHDEETRAVARRCAEQLDGLPAAVELMAPLAVTGLPELAETLRRGHSEGRGVRWVSFASSLDRLDPGERALLDVLVLAGAPVDAELVDDLGDGRHLAALVRDGLVVRSLGSHGFHLFAAVGGLADHLHSAGPVVGVEGWEEAAARRLVPALARAVDLPDQYLVMNVADAALSRRLVALEPALVRAVALACRFGLTADAAEVAVALPELHYARYGAAAPYGRTGWLLCRDDLSPGRRVDLLVSAGASATNESRADLARQLLDRAEALATELDDAGRLAVVLGQRAIAQLMLGVDLGDSPERRREAVRLADSTGRPEVVASTCGMLYPTSDTPADLQDTLPRAVAAARDAHHHGLLALCLANLAMAELERGNVAAAAVHARESGSLGRQAHHWALSTVAAEVAETAEVLTGSEAGLARVLGSLELAFEHHELRRCTEALLRLAAGLRRLGREQDAAICLGVYHALLVSDGAPATGAERALVEHWLPDLDPAPPRRTLAEEVADLVRRLAPEPVPDS